MTTSSNLQHRGNCQLCGSQQAVLASGKIAKHGYTVEHGFFNGTCPGARFAPMQSSIVETTKTVAAMRALADESEKQAMRFESGEITPETVKTSRWDPKARESVKIAWADADQYQREDEIKRRAFGLRSRATGLRGQAQMMERLASAVHGTELIEVRREAAPEPIVIGERREVGKFGAVAATSVDRGQVRFRDARGFPRHVSTRAWRNFPKAA